MSTQHHSNQNCHYILSYHSDSAYVSLAIHGYTPSQEFQTLTEHLLEALVNYKTSKALVDIREMQLISAEDQRWLLENWVPRAMDRGHNICAVINSKYFFNRIAISNIVDGMKTKDFNLQLFEEADKAIEWLKNS